MSAIAVLGSATVDLVVRLGRLPGIGETVFGTSFTSVPGGKGLNQAIAAARSGGDVGFLGAVGSDAYGERVRACLEEAGIAIEGLRIVDEATGTAHISVIEGGDNAITIVPAANSAITSFDPDSARLLEGANYLVTQFERPVTLIREGFTRAREHGISTVLTPAPVMPLDEELLDLVDILVPNALEACQLAGVEDERRAATALSRRVGLVVMTRGERGALVASDGAIIDDVPARRVEVVDTTGAGDTFVGALVAWLDAGESLEDAVRAATVAASISVTRPGTSSSIPMRDEILAALA